MLVRGCGPGPGRAEGFRVPGVRSPRRVWGRWRFSFLAWGNSLDLREFVRKLEKEGELKRVRTEVDPNLEITEIVQRVGRGLGHGPGSGRGLRGQSGQPGMAVPHEGNYALLFEKVRGSRVPLVVNTFGSVRRMCLAFEVSELDEVAARIRGFMDMQSPAGLIDKIKMLPKLAELGSFFPKTVKTGDCKDVRRHGKDVNLL